MKGVSTAFWSFVLISAAVSIGAGFAGGRSIGMAGALPPRAARADAVDLPAPMRGRGLRRALVGAHSLDAAEAPDPYGDPDRAVAAHRAVAGAYDARRDRAKIAVIVIGAGRAGPALDSFVDAPLPLALAVSPADEDAGRSCAAILAAGKAVLVDTAAATPQAVADLLHAGASGVIGSLSRSRSRALLRVIGREAIVVDAALADDDDLYRSAAERVRRAYGRDVIADARDDGPYVEFMLQNALAIAQRTGTAIVAVHARPQTFDALARFADRARRDGADLVALADLGT